MQYGTFDRVHDARVRAATFDWLSGMVASHGDVLQRELLSRGFTMEGQRVPLMGPQGIFKPRVLRDAPLSITTAPEGPYDDAFGADGLLRYRYRGSNPDHPDNRGLRFAMERRLPLVYFHGIIPGRYVATWPVFIVNDSPAELFFSVAVDDATHMGLAASSDEMHGLVSEDNKARRAYITAAVRQRLHQRAFRERVLEAYRHQCSFCRLRHEELLDAAHIIGDTEPQGEPVIRNGLSLCKLHHAAFDNHFVGVRPDYILEVRSDILRERDGPTLVHVIQALNGSSITLPRQLTQRPSRELLEIRYERFRQLQI